MSVIDPDNIDYDEELYDELGPRRRGILLRLYNVHCGDLDRRPLGEDSRFTKDDLRKMLAGLLPDQTKEFLDHYRRLAEENIRTDPAVEYLAKNYSITTDAEVESRHELILYLYEEDLIDKLDELIARARVREFAAIRGYRIDGELNLTKLDDKLDEFHHIWNKEREGNSPSLVRVEFQNENMVTLKCYLESPPRRPEMFSFRQQSNAEIPVVPEISRIQLYQLKNQRIHLERLDEEIEAIFTKPLSGWDEFLIDLFNIVFGIEDVVSKMEPVESKVAREIETDMIESIEERKDPVAAAEEKIASRRAKAQKEIDSMDLPDEHVKDLKDRIETIQISGSNIVDDQSIATSRFQLVATLEQLFGTVDGLEEGFRDLIRKADPEKQAFVITINDRPVVLKDGSWKSLSSGRLPQRDRRALEIFFDV